MKSQQVYIHLHSPIMRGNGLTMARKGAPVALERKVSELARITREAKLILADVKRDITAAGRLPDVPLAVLSALDGELKRIKMLHAGIGQALSMLRKRVRP